MQVNVKHKPGSTVFFQRNESLVQGIVDCVTIILGEISGIQHAHITYQVRECRYLKTKAPFPHAIQSGITERQLFGSVSELIADITGLEGTLILTQ